jgi:hypothetical protein
MTLILLSTAYGDAHGFPFELSKGDRDASRVRGVMAIPGPREWTDDTEFSIATSTRRQSSSTAWAGRCGKRVMRSVRECLFPSAALLAHWGTAP